MQLIASRNSEICITRLYDTYDLYVSRDCVWKMSDWIQSGLFTSHIHRTLFKREVPGLTIVVSRYEVILHDATVTWRTSLAPTSRRDVAWHHDVRHSLMSEQYVTMSHRRDWWTRRSTSPAVHTNILNRIARHVTLTMPSSSPPTDHE